MLNEHRADLPPAVDPTQLNLPAGYEAEEKNERRVVARPGGAGAIRLRPEAAKTGRGRTVMLEGDLAELIDRR